MAITVNTNLSSLMVQRNLNAATSRLNRAVERMTTGLKINKAADDAAGLYVANGLDVQVRDSEVAKGNIQTGINIIQIAEGDLELIQEHVLRIRDLATQAASDYYTTDARNAMQSEINERVAEIDRVAAASNFNNLHLLDGSRTSLRVQVGPGAPPPTDAIFITGVFRAADSNSIGLLSALSAVSTASEAAGFLNQCDTALNDITNRRSAIGAIQNRLESAYNSLNVKIENLSAGKSTIMDADIAKESSDYTKQQILQQASASLLIQANQSPSIALNLI